MSQSTVTPAVPTVDGRRKLSGAVTAGAVRRVGAGTPQLRQLLPELQPSVVTLVTGQQGEPTPRLGAAFRLSVCLSVCLSVLSVCLSACLSVCLSFRQSTSYHATILTPERI